MVNEADFSMISDHLSTDHSMIAKNMTSFPSTVFLLLKNLFLIILFFCTGFDGFFLRTATLWKMEKPIVAEINYEVQLHVYIILLAEDQHHSKYF